MLFSAHDPELVRDARRGDKAAFAALIERHYPVLLASCCRLLRDSGPAHEAAQEAVVRAMLGLRRLRDDERFGAWLVGIGLNVCRAFLAARRFRDSSLEALLDDQRLDEPVAPGPTPAELAEANDLAAAVRAAIAKLPAGQRRAVALFYLGGLTQAEIAEELGIRPGAVKTRLHKARGSLRVPLLELYKEHFAMTTPSAPLIPMYVCELRRTSSPDPRAARHIVFLQERDGNRRLPIWIGAAEATALAVLLDDVKLPRPGAYQFAAALLSAAGGQLREVQITDLTDFVFYAKAVLTDGTTVDARPSDAVILALVTGVPVFVHAAVIEHATSRQEVLRDLLTEAESAPDDARAIADEVRTMISTTEAELSDLQQPNR